MKALNEQVSEARINLAKVSRAETVLYRLIDEVPTRAELAQYQRRFLELYNQGIIFTFLNHYSAVKFTKCE